jgi:hypothetical protein
VTEAPACEKIAQMKRLERGAVLAWINGLKEADTVIRKEEIRRLRALTPAETVREYNGLKTYADWQDSRSEDPERWHRQAAEEYVHVVEVFARAAGKTTPSAG